MGYFPTKSAAPLLQLITSVLLPAPDPPAAARLTQVRMISLKPCQAAGNSEACNACCKIMSPKPERFPAPPYRGSLSNPTKPPPVNFSIAKPYLGMLQAASKITMAFLNRISKNGQQSNPRTPPKTF